MPEKSLPDQLNLEQYKKQAKDLLHAHAQGATEAIDRILHYHPRFQAKPHDAVRKAAFKLADAQPSSPESTASKAGRSSPSTFAPSE